MFLQLWRAVKIHSGQLSSSAFHVKSTAEKSEDCVVELQWLAARDSLVINKWSFLLLTTACSQLCFQKCWEQKDYLK